METVFIQLAVILFVAFVISYIVKSFKQPAIIGYIITGIVISPFILMFGASQEIIQIFSEFGIAFLLFIVGLHLNPKVIKEIGGSALTVGMIQIILTFGLGFLVSYLIIGFDIIASIYVGVALAFSSTIIIMKLLSDKRQMDSLHGKVAIGILIIQDFVAIGALMFISSISGDANLGLTMLRTFLGGVGLIIILFALGYYVLPYLIRSVAKSQELLFLFSICWCFVLAALFSYLGFSIEIGALVAGIILSFSPYSVEISAKIRPLRDFFLIIFFIILGLNVQIHSLNSIIFGALILSVLALIFKPLIIMTLMAFVGYTKRTNFLTGTTLGQISEFSLILLALGFAMGHISEQVVATITLTGIITITVSTYMIIYSKRFYEKFSNVISIFERKNTRKLKRKKKKYDAVLFGYNRIGFGILRALDKIKKKYIVVDFNPDTISALKKLGVPCIYGDAYDTEFLDKLDLSKIKLFVSTIPDFETNELLIEMIRSENKNAIIISRAHQIDNAQKLYRKGSSYVLTPHFLGGEYVSKMIKDLKIGKKDYEKEKISHLKMLKDMQEKGHDHPDVE